MRLLACTLTLATGLAWSATVAAATQPVTAWYMYGSSGSDLKSYAYAHGCGFRHGAELGFAVGHEAARERRPGAGLGVVLRLRLRRRLPAERKCRRSLQQRLACQRCGLRVVRRACAAAAGDLLHGQREPVD